MDAFSAIGLAVLGWVLNEISHRFRANAQRRAALGRALVELLDLHHSAKCVAYIFSEIRTQYRVSPAEFVQWLDLFERAVPPDPQLTERYTAAVTEISATHPVLAFRLRGREQWPRFLANIRSIASPDEFVMLNELLSPVNLNAMEDIVTAVARAHSLSAWWHTRLRMKRPLELPKEVRAYLEAATARSSESAAPKVLGSP